MTSTPDYLHDLLTELVVLFNQQATDLPHMAIHKDCVFRLNGVAYHEQLGRPPSDPLVRLMGCGPAAYRLLLTGVRYAVNAPRLEIVETDTDDDRAAHTASIHVRMTGQLRGTGRAFTTLLQLRAEATMDGQIRELHITMGDADVEMLLAARRSR